MPRARRLVPPLLAALALAASALAISACGYSSNATNVVEGEPVNLGEVQYNVLFSRYLNPNDSEDAAYLVGQEPPAPDTNYFGVFFEVHNKSNESKKLPETFTIIDASKQKFEALPTESLYAFPLSGEVPSQEQIPVDDSTAQQGPIAGALVLFLLPESVSENRPLELEIKAPGGSATVTLDL